MLFILVFTMLIFQSYAWWDTNWGYKQDIQILTQSATPSNYQFLIHLNSTQLGANFDWSNNCDDLRFIIDNITLLDHWTQTCDTIGEELYTWVEIPDTISASSYYNLEMYYSNSGASSISSADNTFLQDQIFRMNGVCNSGTYCNGMDDNSETNYIRSQIGTSPFTIDGSDYVTTINHNSNPFGAADYYFSRYRFLFIPDSTNTHDFGTNSDDGSEIINLPYDSFGDGYATTGTYGSGSVYAEYYGLHGTGTCGSSGTPGSVSLTSGEGYWLDFIMNEWGGGQLAQLCIREGGGYNTFSVANFPNQIYSRQYVENEPSLFNISSEVNYAYITQTQISPNPLAIIYIFQNKTFNINNTIDCVGPIGESCENISISLTQNSSGTFNSVSTSTTTPLWTSSSQPQTCSGVNTGSSCSSNFVINATGDIGNYYYLKLESTSTNNAISSINSSTFILRIIDSNIVAFNQSIYSFTPFEKNSGDKTITLQIISNIGTNNNIQVSCTSGNCSEITTTFTNGINLLEGDSANIDFVCSDNSYGNYSATYIVTSDGNPYNSSLNINCNVLPIYGPISGQLINPTPLSMTPVSQNSTFNLEAQVNCTGLCSTINAYAIKGISDWDDNSFLYRKNIDIDINSAIPSNYQILLDLDSSDLGPDFNWGNNCRDIRFTESGTLIDYWISDCDTINETIKVWIETNSAQSSSSTYSIYMYYNNNNAQSLSNASATFREDQIYLITGRCSGGGNCDMDNHAEGDTLRANINTTGMEIDGEGYVTQIDQGDNPYGANDNYYSRYRLLFIPSSNATYSFGTYSDDDSEISIFPSDGYGSGYQTAHPYGAHDVITTQYNAWHGNNPCGSNVAVEGSRSLNSGEGYWLEYLHIEGAGGEDQQMCINTGTGYQTFNLGNFGGEFFARSYVVSEPSLNSIGTQEDFLISTIVGDTPLWTSSSQNQNCTPGEDGSCTFTWIVNASGAIGTLQNVSVLFISDLSSINSTMTQIATINITKYIAPTFNLISPINNSKKIINSTIELKWIVSDEDSNISTNLYINGIFNQSIVCITGINCSVNLTLNSGEYSWFVNGSDSTLLNSQSEEWGFRLIKNYHNRINKNINYVSSGLYFVNITLNNLIGENKNISILDWISPSHTPGSFNPIFDFNFNNIYMWNRDISNNFNVQYLITTGNTTTKDIYRIGLD